jgi:hypothetical protein
VSCRWALSVLAVMIAATVVGMTVDMKSPWMVVAAPVSMISSLLVIMVVCFSRKS